MFSNLTNTITDGHNLICRLIKLFNLILIITLATLNPCVPAQAVLRQHHETPNLLRYHAQESLKDREGNTWQVLLFPDNQQNLATTYYLRLVAFPSVNSFIHPQSLEILTDQGRILTAVDAYQASAPAPNVGQYDLTPIIPQIFSVKSLKLSVRLQNNRELALKITPEVLSEWQLLTQEIEPQF